VCECSAVRWLPLKVMLGFRLLLELNACDPSSSTGPGTLPIAGTVVASSGDDGPDGCGDSGDDIPGDGEEPDGGDPPADDGNDDGCAGGTSQGPLCDFLVENFSHISECGEASGEEVSTLSDQLNQHWDTPSQWEGQCNSLRVFIDAEVMASLFTFTWDDPADRPGLNGSSFDGEYAINEIDLYSHGATNHGAWTAAHEAAHAKFGLGSSPADEAEAVAWANRCTSGPDYASSPHSQM